MKLYWMDTDDPPRHWAELLGGSATQVAAADFSALSPSADCPHVVVAHHPAVKIFGKAPWLADGDKIHEHCYLIVVSGGGLEHTSSKSNVYCVHAQLGRPSDPEFSSRFERFVEHLRCVGRPNFQLLEPALSQPEQAERAISILHRSIRAANELDRSAETDWDKFVREACSAILKGVPKPGQAQAAFGDSAEPDRGTVALVRELDFLGYSHLLPTRERSAPSS
jgi:hypothetical protein